MPKSHNKKRNVGIIYELLLRRISERLISEERDEAQKILDIISKRFKKGTALYKEFRLFRALAKSHVSDSAIAAAILTEAKFAARRTNISMLEREKSNLIREINYALNDRSIYSGFIPDYKELATIQVLLNDWRDGDSADIKRMAMYESKVIEHLLKEKAEIDIESESNSDIDALVVKIMSEKINKKYKNKFNSDQREILNSYAFSISTGDSQKIQEMNRRLLSIKDRSIQSLDKLCECTENKTLKGKIEIVREKILAESVENMDDQKIVKFLTLIDLCKEIKESV